MGVFGSLWDVGHASGPIATGFLLGRMEYVPVFASISAVLLVATIMFQIYVVEPQKINRPKETD
jgi:hypothetical protein